MHPRVRQEAPTCSRTPDERERNAEIAIGSAGPMNRAPEIVEICTQPLQQFARRRAASSNVPIKALEQRQHHLRVPAQRGQRFAACGQTLECEGSRGFQHSVAGYITAVGDHQRLVDQGAQMIQHRPRVDRIIACQLLRRLQRETAGKYAQSV